MFFVSSVCVFEHHTLLCRWWGQDPAGHMMFSDPSAPLDAYGIRTNGDVVHLRIDPNAAALVAGPAMVTVSSLSSQDN